MKPYNAIQSSVGHKIKIENYLSTQMQNKNYAWGFIFAAELKHQTPKCC